ncbi:MAG: GNAT family N-acetyltransferase, partial [Acidimicrobiales bacterium]
VARRAALAVVLVAVDDHDRLLGGVTYVRGPGPYFEWDGGHDNAGPSGPQDSAGIRMLAVAPEARGRGVGTALVRACVDRARAEGRRRVWLHTTPEMTVAHRLYEREGFRRMPDADWTGDLCLWAYALDLR